MAEIPRHREVDETEERVDLDAAGGRRVGYAVAAVVVGIVILVVVLHLSGVIQPPTH